MEKDFQIGSVGDAAVGFAEGKFYVKGEVDSKVVLEGLKKKAEAAWPAEAVAIDVAFGWLETALAGVK